MKSYAKSNGAGGSAANYLGQDNVDKNGDVDWDNMLSYALPGASDCDEAESDEEKRSRQTASKSPPATTGFPTALTKAKKTSTAVVAAFARYKKE